MYYFPAVGIGSIGMILGSLLSAPLSDRVGRKLCCVLGIGATFALSYLLFVFPLNIPLLYLSRLMMGVGLGVSQSVSTIYIAEVATPDRRAGLAVIPAMTGCLGVNACQVRRIILELFCNYGVLRSSGSTWTTRSSLWCSPLSTSRSSRCCSSSRRVPPSTCPR